jgi:NADH-quinone oxidoreductase subunit J
VDTFEIVRAIAVIVLGASGTWLLLPHSQGRLKPGRVHLIGAILTGIAVLLLATLWQAPSNLVSSIFFYGFGIAALVGGVLTVTSRDPVYSALWFAAVVLAVSGLFLLSGAQFLAAGTIIVYAGAIIVTFLFVIMLAQKDGRASYDRMARSPAKATATSFLLFWSLLYALISFKAGVVKVGGEGSLASSYVRGSVAVVEEKGPTRQVLSRAITPTNHLPEGHSNGSALGQHVAGLGGALYTDHLITVELAGSLLFVALIGALCIATPKPPVRPSNPHAPHTS